MNSFNDENVMLENDSAKEIYKSIKDLPIIDYHCHISPKEIYEDKVFDSIGEMWLSGDHYKWRMMRAYGIDEERITGGAPWKEKFLAFAESIEYAAGSPVYQWAHFELKKYFGIEEALTSQNAEKIWEEANSVIKEKKLSPRILISMSNVEYIGTTDDIADELIWHEKLSKDEVRVEPSFRVDNLLLIKREGYRDYIEKLAGVAGVEITDLASLESAIDIRLKYFKDHSCTFTDVGIEIFPTHISDKVQANATFIKALNSEEITREEYEGFIGYMYVLLAGKYKEYNLVMQLHLGVKRNNNEGLFKGAGPDVGGDSAGNALDVEALGRLLNEMDKADGLPRTIVYTLSPINYYGISTVIGSFRNVVLGAAWWFCDHKRGIEEQINIFAETSNLAMFYGMLSDSRSFLSYTRHDFFRRILANVLGTWVEKGLYASVELAKGLARRISYGNVKGVIGD